MAKKAGRCKNYGGCAKAEQRAIIDADEFNFVCPECGSGLSDYVPPKPTGPNWPLLVGLGLVAAGAVGGTGYWLLSGKDKSEAAPVPTPIVANPLPASARCVPQPLLLPGKRSLYERVLTRPGAVLAAQPGSGQGEAQAPLTRFYVYQRQTLGGEEWLQVGGSAECKPEGWLRGASAVAWKQQITVVFDNPAGRERVWLFKDDAVLERIAKSADPGAALVAAQGGSDAPIVSAEPKNYIDFNQKFYLLPITDFREIRNVTGKPMRLLRVHAISQKNDGGGGKPEQRGAAVMFVIDSTFSMMRYIDAAKEAMRQIFHQLSESPVGREIHFGLVTFRSSTRAVPELEYVKKLVVDPGLPESSGNPEAFMAGIEEVKEARKSSAEFDEDAYAGLMEALKKDIAWQSYRAKYVILITDAGALNPGDLDRDGQPLSETGMKAGEIRQIAAQDRNVTLYAIHLKTVGGKKYNDHAKAAAQYRELTQNLYTKGPLYYPVENADNIGGFNGVVDCLTQSIIAHYAKVVSRDQGESAYHCPPQTDNEELNRVFRSIERDTATLGNALRLEYLGQTSGDRIPDDFAGWMNDRDLLDPVRPNVEVKVLLSRNELSNLALTVKAILDAARAGQKSTGEFFNVLKQYVSALTRDPDRAQKLSLAEMGLLGEYLEGLPYQSHVMSMTPERWAGLGPTEQDDFIREVENKLERYKDYESDNRRWIALGGPDPAVEDGDKVYPVPLDALP
ncbi:vWA domain-containing protein [Methylomagnum ishizawai]|uniref:vWA domain-containing protein n=1 Tax=Methylomagnum ishizawai TaxID=1760988 RepID=UPI001C321983|nr:vWA domain-containing protein [Methylomagnum ishizawai]BBL73344.1 serine/threonine protein kinase [Methylomagnum ishizawai]